MKKKVKMMAIACIAALSCQAQNTIFPTRDLYDTGSMMMYLDAVRHRAANREASYEAYAREMERRREYEKAYAQAMERQRIEYEKAYAQAMEQQRLEYEKAYAQAMEQQRLENERKVREFHSNIDLAVKNVKNKKWNDVIGNVNSALRTGFLYPELYYFRGLAYENLGYYGYALDDYETGKEKGSTNAANALKELKKTLKRIRKETKGME